MNGHVASSTAWSQRLDAVTDTLQPHLRLLGVAGLWWAVLALVAPWTLARVGPTWDTAAPFLAVCVWVALALVAGLADTLRRAEGPGVWWPRAFLVWVTLMLLIWLGYGATPHPGLVLAAFPLIGWLVVGGYVGAVAVTLRGLPGLTTLRAAGRAWRDPEGWWLARADRHLLVLGTAGRGTSRRAGFVDPDDV